MATERPGRFLWAWLLLAAQIALAPPVQAAERSYPQLISAGDAALSSREYSRAESQYREAAAMKAGEALPHIKLGILYYEQARYTAAVSEFEKASTLHSDSLSKSFLRHALKKIEGSRALHNQIESLTAQGVAGPALTDLHVQTTLQLQGESASMALLSPHLEYLLSVDPKNIPILKALAEGHYLSQNLRKASVYYEKLVKLVPSDVSLERRTADAFAAIGNLSKSGHFYRRALRTTLLQSYRDPVKRRADKKTIRELIGLAKASPRPETYIFGLIEDEEYEKAASELKRYLSRNPGDAWAMCVMGGIFEELEQYGQAERLYKKAMKISPDHPLPYFYWGRYLLIRKKEFWLAVQEFEKYRAKLKESIVLTEDPEGKKRIAGYAAQAARHIAYVYIEILHNPRFGVKVLEQAAKESPEDVEVLYDLGLAYFKVKKKISGIQTLKKVISLKPDSDTARNAKIAIDGARSLSDTDL